MPQQNIIKEKILDALTKNNITPKKNIVLTQYKTKDPELEELSRHGQTNHGDNTSPDTMICINVDLEPKFADVLCKAINSATSHFCFYEDGEIIITGSHDDLSNAFENIPLSEWVQFHKNQENTTALQIH